MKRLQERLKPDERAVEAVRLAKVGRWEELCPEACGGICKLGVACPVLEEPGQFAYEECQILRKAAQRAIKAYLRENGFGLWLRPRGLKCEPPEPLQTWLAEPLSLRRWGGLWLLAAADARLLDEYVSNFARRAAEAALRWPMGRPMVGLLMRMLYAPHLDRTLGLTWDRERGEPGRWAREAELLFLDEFARPLGRYQYEEELITLLRSRAENEAFTMLLYPGRLEDLQGQAKSSLWDVLARLGVRLIQW